jgi:serine/threonine-protein kinase
MKWPRGGRATNVLVALAAPEILEIIDGKYRIVRALGGGGMGYVYEARHLGTGRRVAVKVIQGEALQQSAEAVARFQREARAAGAIESQYIADVLDTGVDAETGRPYLVMEFLAGEDLHHTLKRLRYLSPDLALRIVAQACIGLHKAHAAGVVHRDIKPANLFMTEQDGGELVVKIVDFGVAKMQRETFGRIDDAALTQTGSLVGSPFYMSPEQAMGAKDIDHRTDLWSLGVALYEALAGRNPFSQYETLGALIMGICAGPPPAIEEHAPWLPPQVLAIVRRAVARDLRARFGSAQEMQSAVDALLPGGRAIHASMLVPLSSASTIAAAPTSGHTTLPASGSRLGSGSGRTPGAVPANTATGLAASNAGTLRRRARPLTLLGAGAVLVVGAGIVGYRLTRPSDHDGGAAVIHSAAASPPLVALTAAPPAAPAAVTLVPAANEEPPLHSVSLGVRPASASVEVDGEETRVIDGRVPIRGSLGSVHHVHVGSGKVDVSQDVVISASGAIPSSIELPAKAHGGPSKAAAPASSSTASHGAAPATAPPAAPTSEGAIDRDFR